MKLQEIEAAARQAEGEKRWGDAYNFWYRVSASDGPSADQLFALARSAAYSGRLGHADDLLNDLEQRQFPPFQIAMLRADVAERRRDYGLSLHWRREAEKLQPNSYWVKYGIARARSELRHDVDEILAEFTPALERPEAEKQGGLFGAGLLARNGDVEAANALASRFIAGAEDRESWALRALPGMTSQRERITAQELARTLKSGMIVDLGCWLGSLTAALASGLRENKSRAKPRKVIAYDRFEWEESYMERSWPGSRFGLKDGDDYMPWFQRLTARWEELIDVRKADLETAEWTEGPIGLLIVDAMKTPALARRIMATYYPSLQPKAHVFHQDFCHGGQAWWIHLYHYQIRHKFTVTDVMPGSNTVVFRLNEPFTSDEMKHLLATDLTDPALASRAFEYALSIVDATDRRSVLRVYANCEKRNNRPERAAEIEAQLSAG